MRIYQQRLPLLVTVLLCFPRPAEAVFFGLIERLLCCLFGLFCPEAAVDDTIIPDPCDPNPCLNNAACVEDDGGVVLCVCPEGTAGVDCDERDWSLPPTETKLTASSGAADDRFGSSVAVSGDTMVVGAPRCYHAYTCSTIGKAYIFTKSGGSSWTEQAELTASDGDSGGLFGGSVSLSGDTLAVGSVGNGDDGSQSGSVYVFTGSGSSWTQQARLTASDGARGDYFGISVFLSPSSDILAVGAPKDNEGGTDSGSAYIFTRSGSTWTQQAKLTASDGGDENDFGQSVSLSPSGDILAIGAPKDDDNGARSGSAYIFTGSGSSWIQQTKLTAADGATFDEFGYHVSIWGDVLAVGAPKGAGSGSVYIFTGSGSSWIEQANLTASDGADGDHFGLAVFLSRSDDIGDILAIGDPKHNDKGSVYIFTTSNSTWTQQAKLTASDGAALDNFGHSVSISGSNITVGAYSDDDNGEESGSAYVFEFEDF